MKLLSLIENNKLNLIGAVFACVAVIALFYHHPVYALALALFAIGSWTVRINNIENIVEDASENEPDKDVVDLLRKMEKVAGEWKNTSDLDAVADKDIIDALGKLGIHVSGQVDNANTLRPRNAPIPPYTGELEDPQFLKDVFTEQAAVLSAEKEKMEKLVGKVEPLDHLAEKLPAKKSTRKSKK